MSQLAEDIALELKVFGNGFDHQVAIGKIGQAQSPLDETQCLVCLLLRCLAPGHGLAEFEPGDARDRVKLGFELDFGA